MSDYGTRVVLHTRVWQTAAVTADWPALKQLWLGSADLSIYSIFKDLGRGQRLVGEEPRAQSGVRLWD